VKAASAALGLSVRAKNAWMTDFDIMFSSTISTSGPKNQ